MKIHMHWSFHLLPLISYLYAADCVTICGIKTSSNALKLNLSKLDYTDNVVTAVTRTNFYPTKSVSASPLCLCFPGFIPLSLCVMLVSGLGGSCAIMAHVHLILVPSATTAAANRLITRHRIKTWISWPVYTKLLYFVPSPCVSTCRVFQLQSTIWKPAHSPHLPARSFLGLHGSSPSDQYTLLLE